MRTVIAAAFRGVAVAGIAFVCAWVFRLGLMLPIVGLLGAVLAAGVAAGHRPRSLAIAVAVTMYVVMTAVLYRGVTNQVSNRTFEMTWRETGSRNAAGEAGLRLEFAAHPGNYVDVYGSALRDYLTQQGAERVPVEFQVTSDLWCVRGFNEFRIAGRTALDVYWISVGAGSVQGSTSPWGVRHWWCRL
jgi:hypothetical protein